MYFHWSNGHGHSYGIVYFSVAVRKPDILKKLNFKYIMPHEELGIDLDSDKCEEFGESVRKFYFGYSKLSMQTILVYMMVSQIPFDYFQFILKWDFRLLLVNGRQIVFTRHTSSGGISFEKR